MKIIILLIFLVSFFLLTSSFELCNFDLGTCKWGIEPPWNVVAFALLPAGNGFGTKIIKSDGPFLLAQGKYGSVQNSRSTSQPLPLSDHMRILAYRFQRRGLAQLRLYLKNSTSELLLDSIPASEGEIDSWKRRSVILPPVMESDVARIVFDCGNIQSSEDVIAIDDIDVATPANVIWSGQDSKLFTENDIRQREIRRSSKSSQSSITSCQAIKCQFRSSFCHWKTSNIQLLPTKIVNEAAGDASLESEPIRIPAGSSLFVQMFDSTTSQTTVYTRQLGSLKEKEIWAKSKSDMNWSTNGNGWNRVLIPLEQSGMPVIIIIRSKIGSKDFVAFSSIDLVDKESNSLGCDPISPPIQPHSADRLVRLTALQNLKISPIEKLLFQPPITTIPPLLFETNKNDKKPAPAPFFSFNSDDLPKSASKIDLRTNSAGVPPISPAQVSARGVPILPISSLNFPNLQFSPPSVRFK